MNIETTFDLLRSPVRRDVIAILHETNSIARDRLTARVAGPRDGDGSEDDRRRTRVALHHNHLPRLADAGLITYDEETVTATNRLESVAREFPWLDGDEATPTPV